MQIVYRSKGLESICTEASATVKRHGTRMAKLIHLRIDQICSFDTVEMLTKSGTGNCHSLKGNRKGYYAMDLVHPFRLVFRITGEETQIVCIEEIVDYH